ELSTPQLDALDRERTVVILTVSPLETHGPHLPVGVDAFTARHFAQAPRARCGRRVSPPRCTWAPSPSTPSARWRCGSAWYVMRWSTTGARWPAPASGTCWCPTATAGRDTWSR